MKKAKLLNSGLSSIVAEMGHTDSLCICDAGLPFPKGVEKVDLAITNGVPKVLEVLDAILSELPVEKVTIASETLDANRLFYESIKERFADIPIHEVSHQEFKAESSHCNAVVRTGECLPYANIILHAGVAF